MTVDKKLAFFIYQNKNNLIDTVTNNIFLRLIKNYAQRATID